MLKIVSVIVINRENKLLALKRKRNHKTKWYPGKWDVVSGEIKANENPNECFKKLLLEKIGIVNYAWIEKRNVYVHKESGLEMLVFPLVCKINHTKIKVNSDYQEYKWVTLNEFLALDYLGPLKNPLLFNRLSNIVHLRGGPGMTPRDN